MTRKQVVNLWRDQNYPKQSYPQPYTHEPTITVSSTAIALAVDKWGTIREKSGSAQVATWTLKGVNRNNSDITANPNALTLYWKLTNSGTTRTVTIYKDRAMANSVATGNRTGDGAITLAEANSSGISGTVSVTYTADDTDAENQLAISPRAVKAKITIDTDAIRYWVDNTVPTATDGMYAAVNTIIILDSCEEIMKFRMIRVTNDVKVSPTYYE